MLHLGDPLHHDSPPWTLVFLGWALGVVTMLAVQAAAR